MVVCYQKNEHDTEQENGQKQHIEEERRYEGEEQEEGEEREGEEEGEEEEEEVQAREEDKRCSVETKGESKKIKIEDGENSESNTNTATLNTTANVNESTNAHGNSQSEFGEDLSPVTPPEITQSSSELLFSVMDLSTQFKKQGRFDEIKNKIYSFLLVVCYQKMKLRTGCLLLRSVGPNRVEVGEEDNLKVLGQ